MSQKKYILYTDGGSRGNPGISGFGSVLIEDNSNQVIFEQYGYLGVKTNNFAEYMGLIAGLETIVSLGIKTLLVKCDSKLVVNQMSGIWKVKNKDILQLVSQAKKLEKQFDTVNYEWVPREANKLADKLANLAMDNKTESLFFMKNDIKEKEIKSDQSFKLKIRLSNSFFKSKNNNIDYIEKIFFEKTNSEQSLFTDLYLEIWEDFKTHFEEYIQKLIKFEENATSEKQITLELSNLEAEDLFQTVIFKNNSISLKFSVVKEFEIIYENKKYRLVF